MIFQNPYSSLNPRLTVKEIISEPLGHMDEKRVIEVMELVGLNYKEHGGASDPGNYPGVRFRGLPWLGQ